MTQYLIILVFGFASGYLIGSAGARYQRTNEIQRLIDEEATKRRADGIRRKGDILTETEPVESGVISTREVAR